MIHFYVGKPRNGKSLRAMMAIWKELTEGTRHVITNMVIHVDILQALLIERGFPHVNVRERVTMLDDAETKDFWLHRPGFILEKPEGYADKTGPDVDYSPCFDPETGEVKSVLYVIDEVHTHWRARGWSGTPRHVDFYNSQHGKLGDMCIFITQNTKLVDQNFCRLAQDFTYCRNHRLEKHGRFRGDNKFTAHTYPGPVSSANEPTLNVETFKLDLPLAECYDTSAGVGMPGGGKADAGFRAKGIPLKMVWVALGLVLVLVWIFFGRVLPDLVRSKIAGVQAPTPARQVQSAPALATPASPPPAPVYVIPPAANDVQPAVKDEPKGLGLAWVIDDTPPAPLWVQGVVRAGLKWRVLLSDGRVIHPGDERLERIDERGIVFAGRRVFMRPIGVTPAEVEEDTPSDEGQVAILERTPTPTARPGLPGDELPGG